MGGVAGTHRGDRAMPRRTSFRVDAARVAPVDARPGRGYYLGRVLQRQRACARARVRRVSHQPCAVSRRVRGVLAAHQAWQYAYAQRGRVRRAPPQAKERRQACGWRLRSTCVSREACGLSRNNREQRRNHDSPGFYGRSSAAHHSSSLWEPANMIFSRGRHLPARAGRLGRPASTGKCNISTRSDAGTTEKRRIRSRCAAARARAAAARG